MTTGERIRDIRKRRGWDQRRLAYLVGINQGNLCRIEKGRDMKVRTLRVIAKALGVTCGELLDG